MEVVGKDIRSFQETVRNHSSYDFSQYSHTSLKRRLIRILLECEMSMEELTARMSSDAGFLESVIRKVTVHTTELFRDPDVWKKMMNQLLPLYAGQEVIRIWHPGCSTGQEVFSMLIVLDHLNLLDRSEVYGSDINQEVIDKAETGTYKYRFNQVYLENFDKVILNGSGEDYGNQKKHWRKYFQIEEAHDRIRMREFLREKPVYKKMDLVKDDNLFLVNFDLIVCRNVIIYFNSDLQNRVFELFFNNLNDRGSLLLGVHESIMGPYAKRFVKRGPFYFKEQE